MSVIRVKTVALQGTSPIEINVEAHIARGVPSFQLVGLPSKTINEARERICAMLDILGLQRPMQRVTINLTPADLPKEGSHYDVPIALALLVAMKVIEPLDNYIAMGELSLDGRFLSARGVLPAAIYAESQGLDLICPESCGSEAMWGVKESRVVAPYDLLALINHLKGARVLPEPERPKLQARQRRSHSTINDVEGQEDVKRAIKIACAGHHHILMVGPPGVGKSMLAKTMADLMPDLTPQQSMETSMIYSVSDQPTSGIVAQPPFRSPHHTSSTPGLLGGGSRVLPGEISLAHHGILFLDEFAEFDRRAIESLRLVLETGEIAIVRAQHRVVYPAQFMLVAAMNPCKCGNYGHPKRKCRNAPQCRDRYMAKISGPILDRFDIAVYVQHPYAQVANQCMQPRSGETEAEVRRQIDAARAAQERRFAGQEFVANGQIPGGVLQQYISLTPDAKSELQRAMDKWHLSLRGRDRIIRVARTIADFRNPESDVDVVDIFEALGYRQELALG